MLMQFYLGNDLLSFGTGIPIISHFSSDYHKASLFAHSNQKSYVGNLGIKPSPFGASDDTNHRATPAKALSLIFPKPFKDTHHGPLLLNV